MIGFIRGKLMTKIPPLLVLDVQGVGYEIEAPMTVFYQLPAMGEMLCLHTHLVVREDAHILFGFITPADRMMFRTLIKINGVGPKLALTILSVQSAAELHRCIEHNDKAALIRLPGIGKKTAERLLIEMRDKLPVLDKSKPIEPGSLATNNARQEAISALCTLGYKAQEADKMVQAIATADKSCEDIIRLALQRKS